MTNLDRHGMHLPNCKLTDVPSVPNGAPDPASWNFRLGASRVRWAKLLTPDHSPADATWLRNRGVSGILVRAPGEAIVYDNDVLRLIDAYRGLARVIEVGNEPPDSDLWKHAWYMERVWNTCADVAHRAGILLCVGGWQATAHPPNKADPLGKRLLDVYNFYDAIGVHCYDPFQLTGGQPQDHLREWIAAFPGKSIFITEYGIAAKAVGDGDKAKRYSAFVNALPPEVVAAFCFIGGGTADFASFGSGGYDPAGGNSYWLGDAAWRALGDSVV